MNYVLEDMSSVDKEKILIDAECDSLKKGWLESSGCLNRPGGMKWAVDRKNNSYIFIITTMKEFSGDSHFYIFLENKMYEISVDGLFGGVVSFFGVNSSGSEYQKLKKAIELALPVIGRYGFGIRDDFDVVVPSFKEGL